ncbi:hypothetical protein AgCh_007632 [Apium graveolens]
MTLNNVRAVIPEKGTNYIAFTDANQAPDSFKGFIKFLSESYLAGALTANPILYLDVLHEFWNTAMLRTVMNDNFVSLVVTFSIGGQQIEFNEQDVNATLGLPTANLVEVLTQDELAEFMNFINYGGRINLSSLNRTNLRKECPQQTLECWSIDLEELATRLTMPQSTRAARKPTTSSSQKDEVSKKKRKEITLTIMNESGEEQTPTESPLVRKLKKAKKTELTTQTTFVSSQKDAVVQMALESNSQVFSQSSDLVQEILLTTQTPHLDGERLLAGVDLDDTIKTMGDSSVFTEDPMEITDGPSCANHPSQAVRVDQLVGLAQISQQLLTSDMSNQDYQAIMISYQTDVQEQQDKIVIEGEQDGNCDAWLNKDYNLEMEGVLAKFRKDYLIILGRNAKALTPAEVYDAINEVFKAQLKAFHLFGKALELRLIGHEDRVRKLLNERMDEIIHSQVKFTSKFQHFADQIKRLDLTTMEKDVKNLRQSFIALHEVVQQQITSSNDTKLKLNQLHQSRYEPSALLMEGIKKASQQIDIQTLVDSHKHLQIQNAVALGAIMGKLNITLPTLSEVVRPEIPTPLLTVVRPANKTKGEIEARLLRSSTQTVQVADKPKDLV